MYFEKDLDYLVFKMFTLVWLFCLYFRSLPFSTQGLAKLTAKSTKERLQKKFLIPNNETFLNLPFKLFHLFSDVSCLSFSFDLCAYIVPPKTFNKNSKLLFEVFARDKIYSIQFLCFYCFTNLWFWIRDETAQSRWDKNKNSNQQ